MKFESTVKSATIAAASAVLILNSACATKKFVAKTVAPVESRVGATEAKNTDQDKQLTDHGTQLKELDRGLSAANEKAATADHKAEEAGTAAKTADSKAEAAQKTASAAGDQAKNAQTATETLGRNVDGMNRYKQTKTETVLFRINQWKLQDDATVSLQAICQAAANLPRYAIEVQGYTDKTGSVEGNEILSQNRAQEVARYLANTCKIPVRQISILGSGYTQPVGDDHTSEGRKQNRRVEVRLFVPEVTTVAQAGTR
ncbi:MAG: OmpA family protein [Acidobacteriota bacterium]|nr:OmpA family protein [Acidobacteriota bacterium]